MQRRPKSNSERGYVLLTLIFFVAVLAISLATLLPSVIQEARRDREEELVHRGAQYERAIRLYYKKNGRYPAKVEDLENTNMIRYLRKRYKDPMAPRNEDGQEQDFKILRFGDPGVRLQQAGLGQAPQAGLPGAAGANGAPILAAANQLQAAATPNATPQQNLNEPSDAPADSAKTDVNGNPVDPKDAGTGEPAADKSNAAPGSQPYGGGAMVGVVSTNRKDNTIREFNKKHHYYEWQFLYDPTMDRGGLPTGPWQPQTFGGQPVGQPVGQQIGQPIGNPQGGNGNPQPTPEPQQ